VSYEADLSKLTDYPESALYACRICLILDKFY
jgi:hypothetical protein